jgi:hypothetical protein
MAHDALAMIGYGNEPAVLLLADSEDVAQRVRSAATAAGCRLVGVASIADGLARLETQVSVDAVYAAIECDSGCELDRLLMRLEADAASGRHGSVVSAPLELIDVVFARAPDLRVEQLCDPSVEQMREALEAATARETDRLNDVRRGGRLQQVKEEVERIAAMLAELAEEEGNGGASAGEAIDARMIREMIRARRLRDQFFPDGLFADPAWDMLLDLMAARLEERRVAVSSLCIAAAVPPTTALRWIKLLTDEGLLVRHADPQDGRRVHIELSDPAARALTAYLRAAQRISPLGF